jgi:hypothetical protein
MIVTLNGLPCNTCGAASRHVPGCMRLIRAKLFEQEKLKALTLIQPMGTAIVKGPKRIENRVWAPSVHELGKYFLIHVGTKWDEAYDFSVCARWLGCPAKDKLPYSAIIGCARLVGLIRIAGGAKPDVISIDGSLDKKSAAEEIFERNKPWYMAPQWGWVLDDVFDLPEPIPCKGLQKLWNPKPYVLQRVKEQIGAHRL